jgi:hypothetical protein
MHIGVIIVIVLLILAVVQLTTGALTPWLPVKTEGWQSGNIYAYMGPNGNVVWMNQCTYYGECDVYIHAKSSRKSFKTSILSTVAGFKTVAGGYVYHLGHSKYPGEGGCGIWPKMKHSDEVTAGPCSYCTLTTPGEFFSFLPGRITKQSGNYYMITWKSVPEFTKDHCRYTRVILATKLAPSFVDELRGNQGEIKEVDGISDNNWSKIVSSTQYYGGYHPKDKLYYPTYVAVPAELQTWLRSIGMY